MSEDQVKFRIEAQLHTARRIAQVRTEERNRICDRIEMMLHEAKEIETCDALVALARHVLEGPSK